jgi:glycosyltransferase involved in cell wall biosynthesis
MLGQKKESQISGINRNPMILSPMALPFPYANFAVKYNSALLKKSIKCFITEKKIPVNRILLWSYMTTPLAVELANSLPWAGVVVDLVSDPCKVSGAEEIIVSHKKMLQLADVVLCASVPTMNTAKQYMKEEAYPKLHLFEDGFSTELWELSQDEKYEVDIPSVEPNSPIAAYIGGVNSKIWWDAVSVMAREMPEVSFVFVGPKEYDELPCEGYGRNVFWLPAFKEYGQLGAFLKKCSAGLIPYTPTPYVAEMRPAKINEYMVMGLPIVGTKMPELERLGRENGAGVVYLAERAEEFVSAMEQALDENCQEYREKRQHIAQSRSWETVCRELEDHLQQLI